MIAPAVQLIMDDYHSTSTIFATFSVSIFVLGFASGPLILAPLSELYGRVVIYNVTNVLFLVFTMLCAVSPNESTFLTLRFLSGFSGVATITIGSGTIADLMPKEERGKAVSVWSVGTILGPAVGPVIGGYITEVAGWRWMFWAISVAVSCGRCFQETNSALADFGQIGVVNIIALCVLRETYSPVLLERKASRLRKETGNASYRSKLASKMKSAALFKQSIIRPSKMLLCCPVVTILCTYVAVLYGTLYLLFATYSFVFRQVYGFSTLSSGLVFLPGATGTLLGLLYTAKLSDRGVRDRMATGNAAAPEDRLPLIITLPGALTFPIGLFLYGWTVEGRVHWIIPQIGTAVTGFGSILIFISIQTYLIDAFEEYAASAVGANAVLRGTVGALLPLSGLNLYDALGWGWGNSLLGFVALGLAPVPLMFGMYGAKIRRIKGFEVKM